MEVEAPVNVVDGKVLHPDILPDNIKETSYAVRGELYLRAQELQREGREIIYTNIGNPQALGLQPPKFSRQVVALALAPFLIDNPAVEELFPADAIARAKQLLSYFTNGLGPYTDTKGCLGIRQEVADFIEKRDGHPSDPECIFLSNGASSAVRVLFEVLLRGRSDAVLVPIPQYPLYSAVLSLLTGTFLGYELDEGDKWGMDMEKIKKQAEEARVDGKAVRAMVFINPGNPTGQCLAKETLEEVVKFAYDEKVVLMADEVYQENVYDESRPFVSAKKVLMDMGEPYASSVELASFHTVSKGTIGECGLRGGYMELTNIHEEAIAELYKISSVQLCPNTVGQMTMALMLNPPKPGDESYEMYQKERQDELASLKRRAEMITAAFNSLEGVTCNSTDGKFVGSRLS